MQIYLDIFLNFHICINMKKNNSILKNCIKMPFLLAVGYFAIMASAIIGMFNIYKQK